MIQFVVRSLTANIKEVSAQTRVCTVNIGTEDYQCTSCL